MNETFSSPPGGADPDAGDPVSWLEIEQGWSIVASGGEPVGTVASVTGDKQEDIFDGLAVTRGDSLVYVPGEQVGPIVTGRITLRLSAAECATLGPFTQPPPEEELKLPPRSAWQRFKGWFRGTS